jgi:hypothetical protein
MRKTYVLPVALVMLLGMIYILPQRGSVAQSSVRMELPLELGGWIGVKRPPTSEEIEILAEDTEFEKADYVKSKRGMTSILGEKQDIISASIVLSGVDLNNSIHRPERCLPSQGHFGIVGSKSVVELADGRRIGVRRLKTKQKVRLNETDEIVLDSLMYYFFVGHQQMTHDHLKRTFMDMRDRLFNGYDQRWAYITVSMRYGDVPELNLETSEEEAERLLQEFASKVIGKVVDLPSIPR